MRVFVLRFSAVDTLQARLPAPLWARTQRFAEILDAVIGGQDAASLAQRTSLIAFAIRIGSAAIAFFSQVLLARLMGTYEYGIFALVWVAVVIAGSLSCLGMQTSIVRFLPDYAAQGDMARLRGLLSTSRLFVLGVSSTITVVAAGLIYALSHLFDSHYVVPFLIGILAIPMISLADTLEGTARANSWAIRALMPTYIIRPIMLFIFMLVAWMLGYEVNGTTALLCAVIATYVTTVGQLFFITKHVDATFPQSDNPKSEMGTWFFVALPLFLVEGFFFLLLNADVLMVGALMSPDDVAVYYATVKTLALVHFVYFAVKAGVAHQFASQISNPDKAPLRQLARRSVTWTFWPSLAMGLILLAMGPWLLAMFGAEFKSGYPLLFLLVTGVVLRASVGPAESLLNMSGNHKVCAKLFACALGVNVLLNALLIPIYGLYGAALATAVATIFETIALYVVVRRTLGVSMFVFAPLSAESK